MSVLVDPGTQALQQAKTIAFIGLSDKSERYSYQIAQSFQQKGYRIIPINPHVATVLGQTAYADILAIPTDIAVDIVSIFREPSAVMAHLQEIVTRGDSKAVWLAVGVSTPQVEQFAIDHDLLLIANRCIMDAGITQEEAISA